MGNDCDVIMFTRDEFQHSARSGEPLLADGLRDGIALIGAMPRLKVGAA